MIQDPINQPRPASTSIMIRRFLLSVRQNGLKIFIAVAGILLFISAVLRVITPQTIQIKEAGFSTHNFDGSQTHFGKVTYTGPAFVPPSTMSVGTVQPANVTEDYLVTSLIRDFQLQQLSGVPNVWNGPYFSMDKDLSTSRYILTNSAYANQLITQSQIATPTSLLRPVSTLNKDSAFQAAKTFVATHFPNLALSPLLDQVQFYSFGSDMVPVPEKQANVLRIDFTYLLDNTPIFDDYKSDNTIQVYVNTSNQVAKVIFYPTLIVVQPLSQKNPTISLDTAIQNIRLGKAAIITSQRNKQEFSLESLDNIVLKTVSLEYRVNDQSKIVYPFYRFSGTADNSIGDHLLIEVATPAVATTP